MASLVKNSMSSSSLSSAIEPVRKTIHKKSKSSSKTRTLAIAISSDDEGEAEGNAEGEGKSEAKAEGECKSEGKATTIKFESIQAGNAWVDTQVDDTQLESEPF